jgi:hypothetical protein
MTPQHLLPFSPLEALGPLLLLLLLGTPLWPWAVLLKEL